jgi:hypothetical protein
MMLQSSTELSDPPRAERLGKRRRSLCSVLGLCLLLAAPSTSLAQDASSLEGLIQEGIRLRREGDDEKALDVFRQAERLQPTSVRVLLHLATAAQAAGHWVEADTYIRRVFDYREDPYYRRYQSDIAMVEQLIASRVGRFQVVGAPTGAEVRLNGRVVGNVPMSEPHRLEAGNYQLEVIQRGYFALRRAQRIPGGVLTREVVELGRERSEASPTALPDADPRSDGWWSAPWVGWSLAGVGTASAVTAAVSFAVRESQASQWNDDERCVRPGGGTREQQCGGAYDQARSAERIGIAATVGAVVFGGAALIHFLTTDMGGEADVSRRDTEAGWNASCAPGFMGIACEGRF